MDISKTIVCPKCGNVVMVTDQFCSKCFERLERPSFWRRLGAWFMAAFKPGSVTLVIRKNQSFDRQNMRNLFHLPDDMRPEVREKFETLLSKMQEKLDARQQSPRVSKDKEQPGIIVHKKIQEFKFKDASGKEQVYHSLDEMPPETRALFEKVRGRLNLPE